VDRLPAELTPLPESISDGGEFHAGDGTIRWTLHDLWPGQTRYLTFEAQVNPGFAPAEPVALENHLEVEGYWPWEPGAGGPPPPPSYPYGTSTTLTILPGAMAQVAAAQAAAHPPAIYTAKLLDGAIVDKPVASLYVHASPDTEFLYIKEWVWDHGAGDWALANDSGWLPFTTGDNLEVSAGATGKHGQLRWQLSAGDGVKYLGVWAANGDNHTTNLNEGHLLFTNVVSASGQRLSAGQRVQYRLPMSTGQLGVFALSTESGDADLYGWRPRFAFRPHWVSNASESDHGVEGFGFNAEEYGVYLIEVEAAGQDSIYRLLVGGDIRGSTSLASAAAALGLPDEAGLRQSPPGGSQAPLDRKGLPEHPLTLSTPLGLPDAEVLDDVPQPSPIPRRYLPLVYREW
jgi:hypothetical protein